MFQSPRRGLKPLNKLVISTVVIALLVSVPPKGIKASQLARMRHIAPTPTVRSTRKFTIPQNAEVVTHAKAIAISFTTPEHGDVIITFVPESSFATV